MIRKSTSRIATVFLIISAGILPALHAQIMGGKDGSNDGGFEKIWETGSTMATPESVYFDEARSRIYVSNVNGDPTTKDGNGFISLLTTDGIITAQKWIAGLDAPKGMSVVGNRLFVSDVDRLVEIDLDTAKISNVYPAKDALFLNDVTADGNGTVYVSDYAEGHGSVYRLSGSSLELWVTMPDGLRPNGLLAEKTRIVAGTADGKLMEISYETGKIGLLEDLSGQIAGIDGIVSPAEDEYLVSDWAGTILRVAPGTLGAGGHEILSNTSEKGIRAADIGFSSSKGIVYVPTFSDNRVMAYRVTGSE